jgi:hypothetical protein
MNNYSIIANGQELDTFEALPISLNYQVDDILAIDKRNTNFSKTIQLPGTPENNKFFKQIFDVNVDNINFNPNIKIPASITVGNNTIMIGNLQLLNVVTNNESVSYEVAVFGELKNILNEFGDYPLSSLDLSEYNHNRNKENIQNSWEYINKIHGYDQNLIGEGKGYIYPYAINGGSTDIYDTVYIYDLFPQFTLKTYIDKMFEFAGFTYTSNFLNSEYFKQLVLVDAIDKIQMDSETYDERKAVIGLTGTDPDDSDYSFLIPPQPIGQSWVYNSPIGYNLSLNRESGTVDDGGQELTFTDELNQFTSSIFTCANAGRYDIQFRGKAIPKVIDIDGNNITYTGGTSEYLFRLQLVKVDGTLVILDSSIDPNDPNDLDGIREFDLSDSDPHASPWFDFDTTLGFNLSAENVFLEAGDKIRIFFGLKFRSDMNFSGADDDILLGIYLKESYDGEFTKLEIKPSSNASYGNEDLNINSLLSDGIKMKDLFLNTAKAFNLIIQDNPDKANDLIIEPRDDFYKSKQKVKDWTQILDRDSDIKITPMSELDAKTYYYTYSKDDDLYNKEYTDESKRVYGDLSVNVINDFSEKIEKTELMFAPTPCSNYQINNRVAPFFVEKNDENLKPKKVKPRLLFYTGLKDISTDTLFLKDNINDSSPTSLDGYPYVGMWDDPLNPSYDLGFGTTDKIYWSTSQVPMANLYEKFHRSTLNNIININSRLLEASFKLTPKDIADFDFRDIILIDGSYWRVNKIKDYNPVGSDTLTKVVLYKLIDLNIINRYNVLLPVSNKSCPSKISVRVGRTGRYYIGTGGDEITEDCCNSLGGNYVNGVCYLPPNGDISQTPDGTPALTTGNTLPAIEPYGVKAEDKDGNTLNSLGIKVYGRENYVPEGLKSAMILGDNNSIAKNIDNVLIVDDGVYADNTGIYVDGILINKDGITNTGIVIIDGGEDVIFPFDKLNLIDIVDGGLASVRNYGGDSKSRPIIDGGLDSVSDVEPQ